MTGEKGDDGAKGDPEDATSGDFCDPGSSVCRTLRFLSGRHPGRKIGELDWWKNASRDGIEWKLELGATNKWIRG